MAYSPFDLTGKCALITGGNRGIGLGMAQALAQAGADLVIWGTNEAANAAAQACLKEFGRKVLIQKVNVADEAQVDEAFEAAVKAMGRVDSVFANAGIGRGAKSLMEMKTSDYRDVLAVNQDGVFFTLRAAARHMSQRPGGGSLVGVASLAAIEGAARNQHYAATKGAVISMIRATAVELARYGVRANAILPGWIETDMTANAAGNPVFQEKVIARVPARRWGTPADFGGIAVYLASDASSFHSGDTFVIDGGYSIF
jgi:NAD(P)-dependent dehydrogenase (short-subunit alcohol dehydrogenase family)